MSNTVISVEHLTKRYDLGVIGTGTLSRDLNRWWARLRGQPDPYTRIGQRDHFDKLGESIMALDDISFQVEQGEALGIIGKNGAGKSTLLKILSRVTAPTSGVVKVKGRIGSLLEVGTGFHPELTGRENVFLNGAILGMRKEEVDKKFDEIVAFSGVAQFIDTPVKRYSSGMYVRLAFAVAAHLDPEILVVDEVLAVGDAEFQKKCLGKMSDVTEEGRTVLFVSHNMRAISTLTKRSLLLSDGSLMMISKTEKVVRDYLKISRNHRLQEDHISNVYFSINGFKLSKVDFDNGTLKTLEFILRLRPKLSFDLVLTIGIDNSVSNRILTSWSQYKFRSINKKNLIHSFKLEIENPKLPPGNYRVMLGFRINGYESYVYNEIFEFEIKPENFHDSHLIRLGDKIGTFTPLRITKLE